MQLAQPQCGSIIRFEEHGAVGRQSLGEGFVVMPATGGAGASAAVRVSAPTTSQKSHYIFEDAFHGLRRLIDEVRVW